MKDLSANIAAIARHRLAIDGDGVTTLVVFAGCPLRCRYCLNPFTLTHRPNFKHLSPQQLFDTVSIDSLYFIATGGGVTFGGGEPCLQPDFINGFRKLCGDRWKLRLETSLNVPTANLTKLLPTVDQFIIDIKDMNPAIYSAYTLTDNRLVIDNLRLISDLQLCDKCLIRLPLIPDFNTDADRRTSQQQLEDLGFKNFDFFNYKIKENPLWHEANKPVES